jgi:hypothetical protein
MTADAAAPVTKFRRERPIRGFIRPLIRPEVPIQHITIPRLQQHSLLAPAQAEERNLFVEEQKTVLDLFWQYEQQPPA